MTKQATIAVLAVALCSTEAFVPAASRVPTRTAAARSTCVSMQAEKSNNAMQKSAAAVLAGMVAAGSLLGSPVDASMFDTSSAPQTTLQRDVGWGMPNPSKDPENNNAASGKENGSKYDIKQMSQFAKDNSKGAVDYGSAKGTDFGKLAGGKQGVATNDKATEGPFQRDAKRDTTSIADKDTREAANVDVQDVTAGKRGTQTLAEGIEAAKSAITGGTKSSSPQASSSTTLSLMSPDDIGSAASKVKSKAKQGVNSALDATSDLRDTNVDASLKTPKVGGLFGTKPYEQAQTTGRKTADKVKGDVQTAKNALPNSAQDAGNAVKNKVGSDVQTAKNAAPNSVQDAGNAIKNKVGGDVQTAKNAANDVTPGQGELRNAADAAKNKVSSDVQTAKNAVTDSKDPLRKAVDNAVEPGSPASTLLSVEGGFFGADSKKQAEVVGQKTIDKVQSDIKTARENKPFDNNTGFTTEYNTADAGRAANNAKNTVSNKVDRDVKNTKKQWQYITKSNPARGAQNKVNSDISNTKSAWNKATNGNVGDAANNLAQNVPDVNLPDAPKVGGLFGTQPKQQVDQTSRKTANKVSNDVNALKNGLSSRN